MSLSLPDSPPVPARPEVLSLPEAQDRLRMGRSKIFQLIQDGELEVCKIGKRTLVFSDSIDRLIERHRSPRS